MKEMFNLIWLLLGFVMLLIPFIGNVIFRPVHRKKLQSQFETRWKAVENYGQLQLALRCAQWAGDLLDDFFGKKLLSKKALFRCAIFANSILIITLSWVGLVNAQPFGVTPWKNYSDSIKAGEELMDSYLSAFNVKLYPSMDISNA
jgi:hypothetical protein